MKIELFYFDGCPSYKQALTNVKEALRAEGLPDEVEIVPVISPADAQSKRFLGSPTIRIDGVDLEGSDADTREYAFGCRVYLDDKKSVGWPSVEQVRNALRRESVSDNAEPM
jgi:hypothetical protein